MNHIINHTLNIKKNKYLTEKERYQIEGFLKDKKSKQEIADLLGKSLRTIQREIKRGSIEMLTSQLEKKVVYCADVAQRKYEEKRANKGPNLKIGNDHKLVTHIEKKIREEKYSPDAILGEIKAGKYTFETSICTKTLYNYIDAELFLNISNKDLLVKKNKKKRNYRKIRKVALNNRTGRSIVERPEEVDTRESIGHWEMDCVVGQKTDKQVLLVLTERCSRKALIFKMKSKSQEEVGKVLDHLERKYGKEFREQYQSITMDNGVEFINQELIEKSCRVKGKRTTAYYAHPYSSWERGSNENTNKIIRRFIPKGKKISEYTKKEIKRIEEWINRYPRKILGYKNAEEWYEEKAKVA